MSNNNPVLTSIELNRGKSFLKLKYFCEVKDGTHDTPSYVDPAENTYPLVTSKDITEGNMSFEKAKHISEDDYIAINKRSNVEKFDVIMPMIGTIGNPAIIETNEKFSIKNVALFKTNGDVIKAKYLKYLISSNIVQEQIELLNRGGVQSFLSLGVLQNLSISFCENIDDVVAYLDLKTKEIDEIVVSKTRLIKLLEEKRQAIITEAVTKGLNPNVKMKDSGVEWIGEIPDNWAVIQFKRLSKRIEVGIAEAATHAYQDDGVPIIRSTNIKQGKIRQSDLLYINEDFAEKNRSKYIFANDLLTVRTGNAGLTGVVPENLNMSQCFTMLITTLKEKSNPYFYSYFLNAHPGKMYFDITAWGTAQKNISVPILQEVMVPNLTLEEQNAIVAYLDKVNIEYDNLISDIQLQVNKLKEYRQSLIYEAVTGKIDVRDIEIDS